MRPQSPKKVIVRGTVIGGPRPLICLPLVAGEQAALLQQAEGLASQRPDLMEWRADAYDKVQEPAACLALMERLRAIIGDLPLIFTLRIDAEGGMQAIDQDTRRSLISAAIASGIPDIVDVELANEAAFVEAIRKACADHGNKLILSSHDFTRTPSETDILDRLAQAQRRGADIAKLAVMPAGPGDVLRLLNATLTARSGGLDIPMITIAMGDGGRVTRLAGGLFGSDITFAAGEASSAPGQIPVAELRRAMALFYDA